MGTKFKGSKADLRKALSLYDLVPKKIKAIKDGIINSSFLVVCADGSVYVLRIYQKGNRTDAEIQNELKLMKNFELNDIPVAPIFKNKLGDYLTKFNDSKGKVWRAILMRFIKGNHLKSSQLDLIPEFAKYQAKMHVVVGSLRKEKNDFFEKKMIDWLEKERKQALKRIKNIQLYREYAKISSEIIIEARHKKKEISLLPSGEVHLDYDSNNLIVTNKHIKAILDFDDISPQPFILDTANSLWWWLFFNSKRSHSKIIDSYFKSYFHYRSLSKAEKGFFTLFIRMRNATLAALLFVNMRSKIDSKSFKKALQIDKLFKQIEI